MWATTLDGCTLLRHLPGPSQPSGVAPAGRLHGLTSSALVCVLGRSLPQLAICSSEVRGSYRVYRTTSSGVQDTSALAHAARCPHAKQVLTETRWTCAAMKPGEGPLLLYHRQKLALRPGRPQAHRDQRGLQDDFTLVKKYHTHALTLWLCAEQVPARMSWTSGVQQ